MNQNYSDRLYRTRDHPCAEDGTGDPSYPGLRRDPMAWRKCQLKKLFLLEIAPAPLMFLKETDSSSSEFEVGVAAKFE